MVPPGQRRLGTQRARQARGGRKNVERKWNLNSYGIPMEYLWNTYGIPMEQHRANTGATPELHRSSSGLPSGLGRLTVGPKGNHE